jgi:hypothetical protein
VPDGGAGKFEFTVAGTLYNNATNGYGDGEGTDFITLNAGDVIISETAHSGTTLTDYTAELACGTKAVAPNNGSSGTVNLAYGDEVTCTFTNTRNATLDIEKISIGGTGKFDFSGTGAGIDASFSRTTTTIGAATTTAPFVVAKVNFGTKTVQETARRVG